MVEQFMQNFERKFDRAPIEERKDLVKKAISQIIVDRDNNMVKCYVRRIPSISKVVGELLQIKKKPTTDVVSFSSSGDRT